MPISNGSSLTTILAVYGSVVATFTFGWTMYRDLRDRARIKLSAEVRRIGRMENGDLLSIALAQHIEGASEELYVVVSVVNIGRRPMRWKGVGGTYKTLVNGKRGFIAVPRFLPKMLEEQEAHDEFYELDKQFVRGNLKRLYIWDAGGKQWDVSHSQIKQILADAAVYGESPDAE